MAANQQTPQAPADNAKDIKDNKTTSSKKLKTGEVKDQISKGSTMVGRTEANPSGKPDQIDINPMQNENVLSQLNDIYNKVMDDIKEEGAVNSVGGGGIRGMGYVSGSGDGDSPDYQSANIADADTKDNILKKIVAIHQSMHTVKEDIDSVFKEKFGKWREAVPRSVQDRHTIDLTVRNGEDRKKDDRPYRQQSIVKKVIDEKNGKGYVSPESKIEKAMAAKGVKPDSSDKYRQEMEKNSAAYDAIKKKTNEDFENIFEITDKLVGKLSKERMLGNWSPKTNAADKTLDDRIDKIRGVTKTKKYVLPDVDSVPPGIGMKEDAAVWDKPNPVKKHKHLSSQKIAAAKARAAHHNRKYPNMIDNMWAARNEETGCSIEEWNEELGLTEEIFTPLGNELYEDWNEIEEEAEHGGHRVKLGKPFHTPSGPKKRAVYVKNDKGNVVKVNFGDPHLSIKRDQPSRKKSYRARHHCETPGPRWKANYWSCKYWSSTPTSELDKG